jgi:hypothetical protein
MMKAGLVCLAAWLAVSTTGRAQERPNGFFLTSPLGVSSGYDQNFVTPTKQLDENVSLLTTPTFAWFKSTHRSMFSVDYQAEFELFSIDPDFNSWDHAGNMHFRHQFSPRLFVDGADAFLSTSDPTRRLTNSLLLLPQGRYIENAFYTRLGYRLDHKTLLSFRFDNSVTTMDLPGDLAGRLDRLGNAGTVTLDRNINTHHALSANYAYLHIHPLDTGQQTFDSNVHIGSLGYTYTVNPGLTVRLFGGVTRTLESSFTGAAAVDKKIGDLWVSAGYQRYLGFLGGLEPVGTPVGPVPFGAPFAPTSIYQVVAVRAWGNLTRRVGLEGNVQRALNGVTPENRGIKSVVVQVRVNYKLNDRLTLFTRTDFYGQNVSEFTPFPMSRRRYFAGVEMTLSRAPELSDNPRKHRNLPPAREREDEIRNTEGH